jgi:hypothetical protein
MKRIAVSALALLLAGCTSTPDRYAATLPQNDPKYNSKDCMDIRLAALNFNNKTGSRMAIGLASGLLLGPFGLPIAAAADAEREDARKLFAREIHMRCSSKPLPKNLEIKPAPKKDASKDRN